MQPKPKNFLLTILWAGLLVGYLDITAAIFNFMFNNDGSPRLIFRYIASAAFGQKRAYSESSMIAFGALFHFLVAYSFTIFFFIIYPRLKFLSRNRFITGFVYGCFVWCIMNLLIVPNTYLSRFPTLGWRMFLQVGILILAIGIPLSYIAYWFYSGRRTSNQPQAAIYNEIKTIQNEKIPS